MGRFIINGGIPLRGEAAVSGAKNSALPLLAACLLTEEEVVLHNCPRIGDVFSMQGILEKLGAHVRFSGNTICVAAKEIETVAMPEKLSKKIRSSIFLLGSMLGRMRRAVFQYPGGCEIGLRPIDLHLSGLRQLGVDVREEGGLIRCDGRHMRAGTVHFDYPSVGATENVMMAAALLKGRTVLSNVAREPEITDLQNFLNAMGARISGAGTHTVTVEGVDRLRGVSYCPMPDRIVAGTLLAAAAATGGDIRLTNVPCRDLYAVFTKMREMGCEIDEEESAVRLRAPQRLTAFQQLQTQPHPGFPTDMQAQMLALAAMAKGTSVVVENVFENRFAHAGDLNRMGANVLVNGRTAVVQGVDMLYGTHVTARDLRGGAALVIAGLAARGETLVERAELIDRGYERLEEMLGALGAEIRRDSV